MARSKQTTTKRHKDYANRVGEADGDNRRGWDPARRREPRLAARWSEGGRRRTTAVRHRGVAGVKLEGGKTVVKPYGKPYGPSEKGEEQVEGWRNEEVLVRGEVTLNRRPQSLSVRLSTLQESGDGSGDYWTGRWGGQGVLWTGKG